jgi:2-dehydropantoate 2-reductase
MQSLMQEVVAVAQKINIDLTPKDLDVWDKVLCTLSPMGKTSMLQDIEAGRKTEVDIFGGKVVAMGAKYQVQTPVNETVLRIIKVIESNAA